MNTDSPRLKEKYGELIETHRNTEFTNCKEYCMMKDVSEDYRKGDWKNPNSILYGYAGCGDEDCKYRRPSNATKRCIESIENSTTVKRIVELCCCKGDYCFKREDFGGIESESKEYKQQMLRS